MGGHIVHLSGPGTDTLAVAGGRYLREGLHRGDGLLIVATPASCAALLGAIARHGSDPAALMHESRIAVLDADGVLDEILVRGEPDPDQFEAVIRSALHRVIAFSGTVRVYGDMVSLLWLRGQREAAAQLETLWNALQAEAGFALFCSYPIDVFDREFCVAGIDAVLCAHTALLSGSDEAALQQALDAAMTEVLGVRVHALRPLMNAHARPAWASLPAAEAAALWMRQAIPDQAEAILARARRSYGQARSPA